MKKLLIGGQALMRLGSSRKSMDFDYLVNDVTSKSAFNHIDGADFCNANGSKFFAEVWKMEKGNNGEIASAQALFELKAFAFVQHCQNFFFQKADDCEYDMKFLVRNFGIKESKIAKKYMTDGEYSEVVKIINSVKK